MTLEEEHDEVLNDLEELTIAMAAALDTISELREALRVLYEECLDIPDFRPDCRAMRQAREALK